MSGAHTPPSIIAVLGATGSGVNPRPGCVVFSLTYVQVVYLRRLRFSPVHVRELRIETLAHLRARQALVRKGLVHVDRGAARLTPAGELAADLLDCLGKS